ncbi:MAG: hypothetical protein AABX04_06020 [Nanoarchaeota archaeon]
MNYSGKAKVIVANDNESIHQAVARRIKELGYVVATITEHDWSFQGERELSNLANELIGEGEDVDNLLVLNRLISNTGKRRIKHNASFLHTIQEQVSSYYLFKFKPDSTPAHVGKTEMIAYRESVLENLQKLEELISQKKSVQAIVREELIALERLRMVVKDIYEEFPLLIQQFERRRFVKDISDDLTKLDDEEQKWLLREGYLLKKILGEVNKKHKNKCLSILRRVVRFERRLYRVYQELRKKMEELKKDPSFTRDLTDIEKQLDYYEALFVGYLPQLPPKINELAGQGKWAEVQRVISELMQSFAAVEASIQQLKGVLKHRERK